MPSNSSKKRDLARYFSLQLSFAKLKKDAEINEEYLENNPGIIRIGRRDPATGKYQVYYPDGGDVLGGQKTFNASLAHGSPIRATSAKNSAIIALDSKSATKKEIIKILEKEIILIYRVKTVIALYNPIAFDPVTFDPKTYRLEIWVMGNNETSREITFSFDPSETIDEKGNIIKSDIYNLGAVDSAHIVNKGDSHDLIVRYTDTNPDKNRNPTDYLLFRIENQVSVFAIATDSFDFYYMGGTIYQGVGKTDTKNIIITGTSRNEYDLKSGDIEDLTNYTFNSIPYRYRNSVITGETWTPEGQKEYTCSRQRSNITYFDPLQNYQHTISYTYKLDGTFLALVTTNGYLIQEIHQERTETTTWSLTVSAALVTAVHSGTNTLSLIYPNKNIQLNTGKFLVTYIPYSVSQSLTLQSSVFTIVLRDEKDINLMYNGYDGVAYPPINTVNSSQYINEPVLAGFSINKQPYLIKGYIASCDYIVLDKKGHFEITVNITNKQLLDSNFLLNTFILDNGSFWNYYFYNLVANRSFYYSVLCDQTIPFLFLNPVASNLLYVDIYSYLDMRVSFGTDVKTHNTSIIDNNIYVVINHTNADVYSKIEAKAYVAKWKILDNGNVFFDQILVENYKNNINDDVSDAIFSELDNSYFNSP